MAFDEVASLELSDSTVLQTLKDYMASGSFARGRDEVIAEASIVSIANTRRPHTALARGAHLVADLPTAMIDPAYLDRLHFYLRGSEAPKLDPQPFTVHTFSTEPPVAEHFTFRDLLRKPKRVSDAVDRERRVMISRRHAPDLIVTRADLFEDKLSGARGSARLLGTLAGHVSADEPGRELIDAPPRTRYLSDIRRQVFVSELAATLEA